MLLFLTIILCMYSNALKNYKLYAQEQSLCSNYNNTYKQVCTNKPLYGRQFKTVILEYMHFMTGVKIYRIVY